ncbi:MAG: YMGG-like glycine zipper-containing protein [Desulfoferrobacter sp.]
MNTTRKILLSKFTIILVLLLMLLGCAGMNSTQQRTLSGGAMGAGAGAAIGAVSGGSPVTGAVIGGAAGAAGGYLYDKSRK